MTSLEALKKVKESGGAFVAFPKGAEHAVDWDFDNNQFILAGGDQLTRIDLEESIFDEWEVVKAKVWYEGHFNKRSRS